MLALPDRSLYLSNGRSCRILTGKRTGRMLTRGGPFSHRACMTATAPVSEITLTCGRNGQVQERHSYLEQFLDRTPYWSAYGRPGGARAL